MVHTCALHNHRVAAESCATYYRTCCSLLSGATIVAMAILHGIGDRGSAGAFQPFMFPLSC